MESRFLNEEQRQQQRRSLAKMPFEWKLREMIRMQHVNLSLKKASGRQAPPRPWGMSEERYQQKIGDK